MSAASAFASEINRLLELATKVPGVVYKYGTAGFRDKASILDGVFVRIGMLAWLRAVETKKAVGLMVTASHNPVQDNGIKLVDPDGGMLAQSWEEYATRLANADNDRVLEVFEEIANSINVKITDPVPENSVVVLGLDTRPHSQHLTNLALESIRALKGEVLNLGVVTTPQLHHVVRNRNYGRRKYDGESGYYLQLSQAFCDLIGDAVAPTKVIVDGAYGVGGIQVAKLLESVNTTKKRIFAEIRNVPEPGDKGERLNQGVGAEHVQKMRQMPQQTISLPGDASVRCTSFDGDADRIVYFDVNKNGAFRLFDGDKIATLFAMFIKKQLALLPDTIAKSLSIACVQTAYANGASTAYIRNTLGVEVPLAKTGVKYCHHIAIKYDVGIYFEANGHGTVIFSEHFVKTLNDIDASTFDENQQLALKRLQLLLQLINQATGDAMSDFLTIEAILIVEGLDLDKWDAFYSDLPSCQLKCLVKDRSVIRTSDDETRVLEPKTLQDAIDAEVAKYESGRAFARPSGTEDIVRIYAEAKTEEDARALAESVKQAVAKHAGGLE